jgi:hypothetical protein
MDETDKNLQSLFGMIVIATLLWFGFKAFMEWLIIWKGNRNRPISTWIESRVIKASGETGFAVFDSVKIGGQIHLILDRGNEPEIPPEYFRIENLRKVPDDPWSLRHVGDAIEIGKYENLPRFRQGFSFRDGQKTWS